MAILAGIGILILNICMQAYTNILIISKFSIKTLAKESPLKLLIGLFVSFTILHVFQTTIWAVLYYVLPNLSLSFDTFTEAVYFSIVTFTTLGYGDLTFSGNGRILSGIEATSGIMLIGWSSAMVFAVIQNIIASKT